MPRTIEQFKKAIRITTTAIERERVSLMIQRDVRCSEYDESAWLGRSQCNPNSHYNALWGVLEVYLVKYTQLKKKQREKANKRRK